MKSEVLGKESIEPAPRAPSVSVPHHASALRRYAVAVTCVLVAFAVRYWLTPVLGEELPFMLFVAAALLAAWYGGALTGIVALLLGLFLADYFFLPPMSSREVEMLHVLRYFFTASLGIALIEVQHRGRRRTEAAVEELQAEVARRRRSEGALLEAQAQLRLHAVELEHRVAERTVVLARTVESLRDLLYHIAHNLRAPLRAVGGYTTILVNKYGAKLDARAQEYAGHISTAVQRMDTLICDLLEYGRLGHIEVPLTRVELAEAVDKAVSHLAYPIKITKAELTVAAPLPPVQANARLLEQILINLLDNALKFVSVRTTPRIKIRPEISDSKVRLWIEDNGIGVPTKYLEKIFRAFESLHPGQAGDSTGIGLAIVKQGMQRMGGEAGVESEPGAGSRFWVEFDRAF